MMKTDKYLAHHYEIPEMPQVLPLADEAFVAEWKEAAGKAALTFLAEKVSRDPEVFYLKNVEALCVFFAETMGGRLPVIATGNHEDFQRLEVVLTGRKEPAAIPVTVNAFTLEGRPDKISGHRVILLGKAPYSNVPARCLGLEDEDWLERSGWLRLAHECAHYETLRLFGDMQNHVLDEIVADAIGQIRAFGNYSAERQRLFFGLEPGSNSCSGRLSFYCRGMFPWEKTSVYHSVDAVLDGLEKEINHFLEEKAGTAGWNAVASLIDDPLSDKEVKYKLLSALAGTSIAERLNNIRE